MSMKHKFDHKNVPNDADDDEEVVELLAGLPKIHIIPPAESRPQYKDNLNKSSE